MRPLLLLLTVLYAPSLAGQAPAPGIVHASVSVAADPSNSYALYLPSSYSTGKRWPLLLVFDPFGRGEVSVKLFRDAAEKYGFIVVGSNNSRNFQDPSRAIELVWDDVKHRYSIDAHRLYTAGLSGGARVASSIALGCNKCIAAVIACSAGLPAHASTPAPDITDWYLAAGTTDFNYPEQLHLKEALDSSHAASRFVVFNGPHGWMPADVADDALAWLQLRAMIKGVAPVNKDFISSQFASRLHQAQAAQKDGDVLAAERAYREIAADFRTLRDIKEVEAAAKSLEQSDEFRKARKNEKAALELQDDIANKITNLIGAISQGPDNRATLSTQLQSTVDDSYRRQREKASNTMTQQAVSRGLASAFAFAAETGQQDMLKKNYSHARDMFEAGVVVQPDSAWASYLLATAEAQLHENKQAIDDLKKAVSKGLTNRKLLDDSAFDRLRTDEKFKQLVATLPEAPKGEPRK
jgi:dienelactone hydrolase